MRHLNPGGHAWTCPQSVWMDREIWTTMVKKKKKSVVTVTQQVSPVMSHTLYSYRSVEATCGGMCILSSFVLRDVATDCKMLSSGRILLRPDTMTWPERRRSLMPFMSRNIQLNNTWHVVCCLFRQYCSWLIKNETGWKSDGAKKKEKKRRLLQKKLQKWVCINCVHLAYWWFY